MSIVNAVQVFKSYRNIRIYIFHIRIRIENASKMSSRYKLEIAIWISSNMILAGSGYIKVAGDQICL